MVCVNTLMQMIDWNAPPEVQAKGRLLAREITNIDVFLQPLTPFYSKNVWENCAIILSERNDDELEPFLFEMLEWLQDMNWPGATCILSRLLKYENEQILMQVVESCLLKAKISHDNIWERNLITVAKTREDGAVC